MNDTLNNNFTIPTTANFIRTGEGTPVILIHGIAASLHDWDDLIPDLSQRGYSCYALDLLGHGDSPKVDSRAYQMDWLLDHFFDWMKSLHLTEPAILVGHSLGGYIALEYARRVSAWTRGLVLINPF
jgi:pimeloyl-ACP methyl ester carboxylesterase